MWTVIFNDETKYHGTDEVKAKGIYKLIRSGNYGKKTTGLNCVTTVSCTRSIARTGTSEIPST